MGRVFAGDRVQADQNRSEKPWGADPPARLGYTTHTPAYGLLRSERGAVALFGGIFRGDDASLLPPQRETGTNEGSVTPALNILTELDALCNGRDATVFEYGTDLRQFVSPESRSSLRPGRCIALNGELKP